MSWHRAARSLPLCLVALACLNAASLSLAKALVRGAAAADERRDHALIRLGVDGWHQAGILGRGIKVAVLDSGFQGYHAFLGGALPNFVTAKSFRRDGNLEARDSQHGILCGEVVHALAPDAELLFVNWEPDQPDTLIQAVRWAKQEGAKVLSCSLIMPSWSDGEGGGTLHGALRQILGAGNAAGDMLFFASAGNLAQRHWCGQLNPDASSYHQWSEGQCKNLLTPWGEERVSVELYGRNCKDLELQVFDALTTKEVGHCRASCENSPCGCPCAVVRFLPQSRRRYYVNVRCDKVDKSTNLAPIHVAALGGSLQYSTACGSISFPADGSAVQAVGAVDTDGRRMSYSSCGPNSPMPKPDFVAEVPFQSSWRDRPFAGTSAAAPQAAALAALVWARHPNWTAKQVCQEMRRASLDLGPMGHDWQTGHGLLRLPTANGECR